MPLPRTSVLVLLLLVPLQSMGATDRAEDAYNAARRSYYALKGDPARRKFRHHWLRVARSFDAVATKYPRSQRAPDALYTAADLLEELSRISRLDVDLQAAVADYRKLLEAHPKHRLADDAALRLGKILADRMGQPEAARKVLARALALTPRGDMRRDIQALHASLTEAQRASASKGAASGPSAPPRASAAPAKAVARVDAKEKEAPGGKEEPQRPQAVAEAEPREREVRSSREPARESSARQRLQAVARPLGGEITLAEQLGLKVRKVVIDAGHGGHDTGAIGPTGVREKDVTLAIAKRVAEKLEASGIEVQLTREDDTFVRLEDRAKMANEARGDLFISIHCNAAPSRKLRGVETYTLNTASDRYSIRLAARENSSSVKRISDLQFILADLATKAHTEESRRLAERVQESLVSRLSARYRPVKDLGTKEALFYVLLGTKMPSILVETSFLSNPVEEKRLSSKAYQEHVAAAIAGGVQDFLGNRLRLAKVN